MNFEKLLPRHKGSLHLTHNEHKANYETVKEFLDHKKAMDLAYEFTAPDGEKLAIATDEIWELQWYPDNPVGFDLVFAHTFASLVEWLAQAPR